MIIWKPVKKWQKKKDKSSDTGVDSAKGVYKAAVINDPDGYTNVRATPDSQAEIVAKIVDGEQFYFDEISNSKWVKVYKTADSEAQCIGYMHNSRVKLVNDNWQLCWVIGIWFYDKQEIRSGGQKRFPLLIMESVIINYF